MLSVKTLRDKKEFFWVDFFRVVFAIGIVTFHSDPLKEINSAASYFLSHVLTRLGVPFFLMTSGFFLCDKLNQPDRVRQYAVRLLQLYLIYSAIYFPEALARYIGDCEHFASHMLRYFQYFFLIGSSYHLWYFLGLIYATLLLYFLCKKIKMKDWQMVLMAACLYAVGVVGNAYIQPLMEGLSSQNHRLLWVYYKLFNTTRNGFFFCFPYLLAGYLIAKHKGKVCRRKYAYAALASFALLCVEAYVAHTRFGSKGQDMLFMLFPTAVFVFLAICFMERKESDETRQRAIHYRKLSVLIYGFHPLLQSVWLLIFNDGLHLPLERATLYIVVVTSSVVWAEGLIRLSRVEKFKWLKRLY